MIHLGLTEAALQERRNGIGASDAHTVIRGTPEERYRLWQEKRGEAKPRKIMSDWDAAWRYATEALQLDWYEHTHPGEVVVNRGAVVVSERYPFMRCTLDGAVNNRIPINAKHLSRWTKEAREWAIEHYTPQIVHEAICCGADYGLISLLHGEKEPEIIKIEVDPFFAEDLIAMERAFWHCVKTGVPPEFCEDLAIPNQAIPLAKLRTIVIATTADHTALVDGRNEALNWSGDLAELVPDFAGTEAAAKKHAIVRDRLKGLIPEDCGDLTYGLFRAKRSKAGALTMKMEKGEG